MQLYLNQRHIRKDTLKLLRLMSMSIIYKKLILL